MKDNLAITGPSPGHRAASYWFVDGLPDIVLGVTLLIFGAAGLWWCVHRPKPSPAHEFFVVAIGLCFFFWKGRPLIDLLKSRLTYPRTGYARPPEDLSELGLPNALTALSLKPWPKRDENVTHFLTRTTMVVLWWCFFALNLNPWSRWYTLLAPAALAVALYAWNRRSEHPYRWWSALLLALIGPALLWLDLSPLLQPLLMPLLAGAWLATEGACVLVHYLRANPSSRAAEGVRA